MFSGRAVFSRMGGPASGNIGENSGAGKREDKTVVGYFAVILRQSSFFVTGKDRRVHTTQ